MSNTPSWAEIEALAQQHLKAFVPFSVGEVWFEGEVEFARAVLARWGTPQPVAREPLTPERIEEICADLRNTVGCNNTTLARAIEAEVRKRDEALIRWMLEALETAGVYPPSAQAAITTARARLGEKT